MTRYATSERMYQCHVCEAKFIMRHVRKYIQREGTALECTDWYCPGCGGNIASSLWPSIEHLAI